MRLKGETLLASVGRDGACWAVRMRMRLLSQEAPWQKQAWDLIGTVIHPNIPPPRTQGPPGALRGLGWGTSWPSFLSLTNPHEHLSRGTHRVLPTLC